MWIGNIVVIKKGIILMAGSTFGTLFKITTWGESHGVGVGVVIDGCPAGLHLCEEDIQKYLDRRKPGQNRYTTKRSEPDAVRILSGVFEGETTGTPISLLVMNEDHRSKDYGPLKDVYRPGHADQGFDAKFGIRDYRGGGRSSGRETIGRVAAGAVAAKILGKMGIRVQAYTSSVGPITCNPLRFNEAHLAQSKLQMPDPDAEKLAQAYLDDCIKSGDSSGGIVECVVEGMPAGLGEPVFDKLDALLGQAIFSIGAVKGVEIGDGFAAAKARGSDNNDRYDRRTNHAGGILGGISNGNTITLRAAFKPTPSISRHQRALGTDGRMHDLEIKGRHDPLIAPRATVVVECMTAIVILDLLMRNMSARVDNLRILYREHHN